MIFKVVTYEGIKYQDEIKFAVVKNSEGETGILSNHIPIILTITDGFIKLVNDDSTSYLIVEKGFVSFKDNELNVIALDVQIGCTYEQARNAFYENKRANLQLDKKDNVDFSQLERELRENIMRSKAGHL